MADVLNTNTPSKTPVQRGWRTLLQSAGASLVGLLLTVWNVPGVPQAVSNYAQANFVPLLLGLFALIGIPAAVISFVQNYLETKRKVENKQ